MIPTEYEQLRKEIDRTNVLLREKKTEGIDERAVSRYFDNFRKLFILSAQKINIADADEQRRAAIWDIVELNGLYSIQLTLGVELPADLEEIAYDYDHDDYPGYGYRLDNIIKGRYLVLGGKGHQPSPNPTAT